MIKLFFVFLFCLLNFSEADTTEKSKASMDSAMGPGSESYHDSYMISSFNRNLTRISYGFAAILAVSALYCMYRSRSLIKSDSKKGRRLFFIGLGLCLIIVILLSCPTLFFMRPQFPGNFDMRTT